MNYISINEWCQDDSLAVELGLVGAELAQIETEEFCELCIVRRDGSDIGILFDDGNGYAFAGYGVDDLYLQSLDDFLTEYRLNGNSWWQDRQDKYIAINRYGDEVNSGPDNTWTVYRCSYNCQRELLAKQVPYIRLASQAEQRQYKASGSNDVYYSDSELESAS